MCSWLVLFDIETTPPNSVHNVVESTPSPLAEPDSGRGLHRRGADVHHAAPLRGLPGAADSHPPRGRRLWGRCFVHHGGRERSEGFYQGGTMRPKITLGSLLIIIMSIQSECSVCLG